VSEPNVTVIRRFYEELWNEWQLDLIEELPSPTIGFRGSLGSTCNGRDEFTGYVETVRAAFPDWHNRIDEILAVDDRVVTRMTWTGTHRGRLGEVGPTGTRSSTPVPLSSASRAA
jgi:SnoaL-like polyketide cyclase